MTRPVVVVADDDAALRQALARALGLEGFDVVAVDDGGRAVDAVRNRGADLVVLDVRMPFVDGLTACRSIRAADPAVPVLLLTACTEVADRVAGLDAGADDYLGKPFATAELLARISALLRRSRLAAGSSALRLADLTLDPATRTATRGRRELQLTRTEFDVLHALLASAGAVLSRQQLGERVWGYGPATTSRSLDAHVAALRRKLEAGGAARLVRTVRGVGFVARAP